MKKQPRITSDNSGFDCWPQVSVVFTPCSSSGSFGCSSRRRGGAEGTENGKVQADLLQKFSYQKFLPCTPSHTKWHRPSAVKNSDSAVHGFLLHLLQTNKFQVSHVPVVVLAAGAMEWHGLEFFWLYFTSTTSTGPTRAPSTGNGMELQALENANVVKE